MSSYLHHTIVVSAAFSMGDDLDQAHAQAVKLFGCVSPIIPSPVNGRRSFFVPPDGSKEGWDESNAGDAAREEFKAWLQSRAYDDGSNSLEWVEVSFGGDDRKPAQVLSCGTVNL